MGFAGHAGQGGADFLEVDFDDGWAGGCRCGQCRCERQFSGQQGRAWDEELVDFSLVVADQVTLTPMELVAAQCAACPVHLLCTAVLDGSDHHQPIG